MSTALVLEGGAMRGMYTCGVLDAFLDFDLMFDYVIGVSAGAAFGASYISKQRDRNLIIYKKYINDKRYISYGNFLKEKSLFGLKFVYEDIPKIHVPFDFKTFYDNPSRFLTVTTDVETGLPHCFEKSEIDDKMDVLKATCALPIFSPIIEIENHKYLDGGLIDPIPFKKAFEDGFDKAVVVLTQDASYKKTEQKLMNMIKIKYFKYPKIYELLRERHHVYNQQLKELAQLEKQGKALIIRPKFPVGFKRIETDLEKLETLYHQGEDDVFQIKKQLFEFIK